MFPEEPVATKVLFPKVTPSTLFAVGEVALSKDEPLSVDLTMFPEEPTATNVLFPNPTPQTVIAVGEVALSQVVPLSVDLTMFPELPTATNTPELDDEEDEEEEVDCLTKVPDVSEVSIPDGYELSSQSG